MASQDTPVTSSFFMAAALLASVAGLLFFYNLGEEDLDSDAQARVLLTAGDMNANKTWLVPTVDGQGRWEKPPLYVWSVKLTSFFYGGEVDPLVGRIPGAVAMFLLVMLGAWWTYQHLARYLRDDNPDMRTEAYALLTGLILATNPEVLRLAREGVADSLFVPLCFGALYCMGESFEVRRSYFAARPWRQWVLAAYVLMGLGMMTKGPAVFLFVLIPYAATCWNYKLFRPDPIHLAGAALALLIGGWWYFVAMRIEPAARGVFMDELFGKRFGPDALNPEPWYVYLKMTAVSFFPWVLLSVVMAWRVVRRTQRTPTTVLWTCAFLSGLVWLSLVGSKKPEYFMVVAPFILLLAGDALTRWHFDTNEGKAFRWIIRGVRWIGVAVGVAASIWISSKLGIALAITLAVLYISFWFHRFRMTYTYALWERTVQAAVLLLIVFVAVETVYVRDYIPRKGSLGQRKSFVTRVSRFLPEGAQLYIYGREDTALYSYLLGSLLPVVKSVDELIERGAEDEGETWLLSDEDVRRLMREPRLAAVTTRIGGSAMRPRAALFKLLPEVRSGDSPTLAEKYASVEPLRLVVMGDAGAAGTKLQRKMADRIEDLNDETPIEGVILLGDALRGHPSPSWIDFHRRFERPNRELLKRGLSFHNVMGEHDQKIAFAITRYPIFQMGKRRYYRRPFHSGLVDFFALDSVALADGDGDADQWAWLETELAESDAPWKIVGLFTPLASRASDSENDRDLAERLLPLFDAHGVDLVMWSDEHWYQRIEDPEHGPVFIGAGWSGDADASDFKPGKELRRSYTEELGFVLLEITPDSIHVQARDIKGLLVDDFEITHAGE